jgi:signal peptidase II
VRLNWKNNNIDNQRNDFMSQVTTLSNTTTSDKTSDDRLSESDQKNNNLTKNFRLSYLFWLVGIAVICTFFDLWTKQMIFERLGMPGKSKVWWVCENIFGFQTALNEGALFGMGQGFAMAFAVLSIVMLVGILVWVIGPFSKNLFLVIVVGLISGGIAGNLYDRLGLHQLRWNDGFHLSDTPVYAVRDWILVMLGSYHWPNFNLADSYLVCGIILLAIYTFFFTGKTSQKI